MPIYATSNPLEKEKAKSKFEYLINKGKVLELKEKKATRSLSQNRYLHLILSWYALEDGERMEYIKQEVFKKVVNPDIFKTEYTNRKTGEIRIDWLSSSKLNTGEMTIAIDRFRDYASREAGIYLPEPKELAYLREIEREIENSKQYL